MRLTGRKMLLIVVASAVFGLVAGVAVGSFTHPPVPGGFIGMLGGFLISQVVLRWERRPARR